MEMRKALVALAVEAWGIIDRDLGDPMGKGYSDAMMTIALAWRGEKGYLNKGGRIHALSKTGSKDEEIVVRDTVLTSLMDLKRRA